MLESNLANDLMGSMPQKQNKTVPPSIVEAQTSQMAELAEHSNVSLQCKTAGNPKPNVVWHRDDGLPIKLNGSNLANQITQPTWPRLDLATNQTDALDSDLNSDLVAQDSLVSRKLMVIFINLPKEFEVNY